MKADDLLLLFLAQQEGFAGWLRLAGGRVADRGTALGQLPLLGAAPDERPRVVAVVPAEAVALHWLELQPGLAQPQAAAAARIAAGEISAEPAEELHVAVGPEQDGATRCVAVASRGAVADWIERCRSAGLDPDSLIPQQLLLARPAAGVVRCDLDGIPLFRGAALGFGAEEPLSVLLLGDTPVERIDDARFEAQLPDALASMPVDLRQGPFARRRRWKVQWPLVRRLALLGMGILIAALTIQITLVMRYTLAADRLERDARELAASALPGGAAGSNPAGQLARHVAGLRGSGVGYSAIASRLCGAVRDTANAELTAIEFDGRGLLRAGVAGDTPATLSALEQRIEAAGLTVEASPMRSDGGRQAAEFMVRAR